MLNNKNGIWQIVATATCTLLAGIAMGWVASIADEVDENTEARNVLRGVKVEERLTEVEKKVGRVEKNQIALHGEERVDRQLLNAIAEKLRVPPAPEVQPLPEDSE